MILLDSSLIVAYSNERDIHHGRALKLMEEIDGGLYGTPVISDYIFDEVVTVLLIRTGDLEMVGEVGRTLLESTMMLRVDEATFKRAWQIFLNQPKPTLSFTDCTSIALCRGYGVGRIATFNMDFKDVEGLEVIGP